MPVGNIIGGDMPESKVNEKVMQLISVDGAVLRLGNLTGREIRHILRNRAKCALYYDRLIPGLKLKPIGDIVEDLHAARVNLSVSKMGDGNLLTGVIKPICSNIIELKERPIQAALNNNPMVQK